MNTVFTRYHFPAALKMIHEKNSRVSLCVQELFHPRRSLRTLATSLASRKATVFTVPVYVHSHIGVMLDWVSNLQFPALIMSEV